MEIYHKTVIIGRCYMDFPTRRKTCLDIEDCDLAFLTSYLHGIIMEPVSDGLYGQTLGKIDDLSIRKKETMLEIFD